MSVLLGSERRESTGVCDRLVCGAAGEEVGVRPHYSHLVVIEPVTAMFSSRLGSFVASQVLYCEVVCSASS